MKIRYRVTGDVRDVDEGIARALVARHLADACDDPQPVTQAAKTRRQYHRRDMRAQR